MRTYEIHGSCQEPDKKWRTNMKVVVVTTDAARAIHLATEKHPSLEVWSLQHGGKVDIIDESTA